MNGKDQYETNPACAIENTGGQNPAAACCRRARVDVHRTPVDEHSEAQVFPAFDGGPWGRLNRRATTRVAPRGEATRKFADSFQVEHISAAGTCSKRRSTSRQ